MAQPLPPEPPRLPEAPDRTRGHLDLVEDPPERDLLQDQPEPEPGPERKLLQEPPERKVTGPRVRPGLRKRPAPDTTALPPRGVGMTITSYLISGLLAYGLIGWLIGRAVHAPILTAIGMLVGLGISMWLIIYRYGRSTPPRIRRFAPKPAVTDAAPPTEPEQAERPDDNDARGTDR
ncbi:MAG: AtpZ/AtpI family protein [Actinobacteria bacterium]|nr:AtpZ/AtpI family protein [Actinomycetota bacterium]